MPLVALVLRVLAQFVAQIHQLPVLPRDTEDEYLPLEPSNSFRGVSVGQEDGQDSFQQTGLAVASALMVNISFLSPGLLTWALPKNPLLKHSLT